MVNKHSYIAALVNYKYRVPIAASIAALILLIVFVFCPQEQHIGSREMGNGPQNTYDPLPITFINNSGSTIDVIWINTHGRREDQVLYTC